MIEQNSIIGITSCSKSKTGAPDSQQKVKAVNRYDSWLFDGRIKALKANCDEWIIFSGKYGCLKPDDKIPWYDKQITDNPKERQIQLAQSVADYVDKSNANAVMILMGRDYAKPLKKQINNNIEIIDPLKGVQLFDQRSELEKLAQKGTPNKQTTFNQFS